MEPSHRDLTPDVGAQTDIAPLGRDLPKPAHELTADEEAARANWNAVTQMKDFHSLLRAKLRFIIPATAFFFIYYLALPILVGYWPALMTRKVFGEVNIAYLFALSQFVMAWTLAGIYVAVAAGWDRRVAELLAKLPRR